MSWDEGPADLPCSRCIHTPCLPPRWLAIHPFIHNQPPSTAHLHPRQHNSVPGTPGTPRHTVNNDIGYTDIVFSGKKAMAARVETNLKQSGFIPEALVHGEVDW